MEDTVKRNLWTMLALLVLLSLVAACAGAPAAEPGQRRPRSGRVVDAGAYKIILMIDSTEIQTKKLEILDDPILNNE